MMHIHADSRQEFTIIYEKYIVKNVISIFFYIKDKKHYNFKGKTMKI